tara:strand:- start:163 stop:651 length:489 start_codon:yes stop_codon:yes gene_type:complete
MAENEERRLSGEDPSRESPKEREDVQRPSDTWVPQGVLPEPEPQDGYVFRWIRTTSLGHSDNTNVSMRFRQGWEPVKAEDHPELKIVSDHDSLFEGNVEVGGLLLCKCPEEIVQKQRDHNIAMAKAQMDGVESNLMNESDPRMPMLNPERSTKVTFGGGSNK